MKNHLELTDEAFEKAFEAGTFPSDLFSHEAHIRLAWIHIKKYGLAMALQQVSTQLWHYVSHLGARDKFHMTLTMAAIKAVHHFMERSSCEDFSSFMAEFPPLKTHFMELMGSHYSRELLGSEIAKTTFLEPDVLPFE